MLALPSVDLSLDPNARRCASGPVAYWGVDDADEALKRLLEAGAQEHTPVQDVGDGIRTGAVLDPFGNTLAFIKNPHFSLPK